MPAGRDPGRRPRDPARPADRDDPEGAARGRRQAVRRRTSSRLLRRTGLRSVVLCVGAPRRDDPGNRSATAAASALESSTPPTAPTLLGTGGALRRALPLLGERSSSCTATRYLTCDYAAVERAFEASGKLGLMTVYRNEGRWDRATSSIATAGSCATTRPTRRPTCGTSTTASACCAPRRSPSYPPRRAVDLADRVPGLARPRQLAGYEVPERFYEIGSPAGLEETRALLVEGATMSYARQHLDEAKRDHRSARRRRHRARWPRCWPRCASAAAGCSSSASAAAPATARTRSTTFARSPASRPTRRPTTCPS